MAALGLVRLADSARGWQRVGHGDIEQPLPWLPVPAEVIEHAPDGVLDQEGSVLDILVQSRRNAGAAKRFLRKLLRGLQYVPRVIITDKLRSYAAATREVMPGVEHR
jgi:hypothetical protein